MAPPNTSLQRVPPNPTNTNTSGSPSQIIWLPNAHLSQWQVSRAWPKMSKRYTLSSSKQTVSPMKCSVTQVSSGGSRGSRGEGLGKLIFCQVPTHGGNANERDKPYNIWSVNKITHHKDHVGFYSWDWSVLYFEKYSLDASLKMGPEQGSRFCDAPKRRDVALWCYKCMDWIELRLRVGWGIEHL